VTFLQLVSSLALLVVTLMLPVGPGRIALFALGRTIVSAIFVLIVLATSASENRRATVPSMRDLLRSAHPFLSAEMATSIYLRADLTLVALFLGAWGAGVYGPALNLVNMTFMVPNALYFVVVPILSQVFSGVTESPGLEPELQADAENPAKALAMSAFSFRGQINARQSFVRIGAAQLAAQTLVGAVMSAVVFTFAPAIIHLVYGSAYQLSVVVLRFLSPIPFLKSMNFGLGALLTTSGGQPQRAMVQVLCAAFNVVANLAVVFPFGIAGVAIVYTFSEVFLLLGYSLTAYRRLTRS